MLFSELKPSILNIIKYIERNERIVRVFNF